MARRPNIIRPASLNIHIPEDVKAKLDLHLYSEVEARIPKGAYQRFFVDRIREFFTHKTLDITQYVGTPTIISGSAETIATLKTLLEQHYGH